MLEPARSSWERDGCDVRRPGHRDAITFMTTPQPPGRKPPMDEPERPPPAKDPRPPKPPARDPRPEQSPRRDPPLDPPQPGEPAPEIKDPPAPGVPRGPARV